MRFHEIVAAPCGSMRATKNGETRRDGTSFDADMFVVEPNDCRAAVVHGAQVINSEILPPQAAAPQALDTRSSQVGAALRAQFPSVNDIGSSCVVLTGSWKMVAVTLRLVPIVFSIRADARIQLPVLVPKIESALGCELIAGEHHGMPFLVGQLLGMKILLGEWRGLGRARTYQLHGVVEQPIDRAEHEYEAVREVNIGPSVIELLANADGGEWRVPSTDELIAESEHGSQSDRDREAEDAAWEQSADEE